MAATEGFAVEGLFAGGDEVGVRAEEQEGQTDQRRYEKRTGRSLRRSLSGLH